jgi:hypothetical protein
VRLLVVRIIALSFIPWNIILLNAAVTIVLG